MNRTPLSILTALFAVAGSTAVAQVAPAPRQDDPTVMTAFAVVADPADSYEAVNLASLTGSNKPLAKLPITAEILTEQTLKDLAVTSAVDALREYATGIGDNYNQAGSASQAAQAGDTFIPGGFKLRGLAAGRPQRNGFLDAEGTVLDGLNLSRVEVIRGPQALIYGPGSPGGVLNIVTKSAIFGSNRSTLEFRADDLGSFRGTVDVNRSTTIAGRAAAIRIVGARDNQNYWRTNIGQETAGYLVSGALVLFKPTATTLRFEYERIHAEKVLATTASISGIPAVVPNGTILRLLLADNSPALRQIYQGRLTWENVDSFGLTSSGRWDDHRYTGVTLSSNLTSWLQAQVIGGRDVLYLSTMMASSFALRPPLLGGNPLNEWANGYNLTGPRSNRVRDGLRATFTADFNLTRFTKNNFIFGGDTKRDFDFNCQRRFFELDANGNVIVNQAQINNAVGGRLEMPIEWVGVERSLVGYVRPTDLTYRHSNGKVYRREYVSYKVPSLVTAANPQGYTGGATVVNSDAYGTANGLFAALTTEWLGGKVDTLASIRADDSTTTDYRTGVTTAYPMTGTNAYNLGAVWHALPTVAPYVGWSTRLKLQGGFDLLQQILPLGKGESHEYGVKFALFGGRISGSAAYFKNTAMNETVVIDTPTANVLDPSSLINGARYANGARLVYDPSSTGYETAITAKPTPNWRVQLGYSYFKGSQGSDVVLPILYNDQFRADAAGQVLLRDGAPLRVPVAVGTPIASDGRTYAASVATQIMTVNILKNGDASGNYKAALDPASGRFLSPQTSGLTVPGVGTGVLGLPIAQHQLGFVPPSGNTFLARKGGDRLLGNPSHSFNIVSMYRLPEGRLRGTSFGFNAQYRADEVAYYYTDLADGGKRKLLPIPDTANVNLMLGYDRRIGRNIAWRVQLNLNNVFDRTFVRYYPNLGTGAAFNAVRMGAPRALIGTTSFAF